MLTKTKGFVLNTVNYGESSIIAKIYTEQSGLQSFLIHSIRKQKTKISKNLFQNLSFVELISAKKKNNQLQYIKEISSFYKYQTIPFEIKKSSVLLFINEILFKSIKEDSPNSDLFNFVVDSIVSLDKLKSKYSDFHLYFIIHLTKYLGVQPLNNYSETKDKFSLKNGSFQENDLDFTDCLDDSQSKLLSECLEKTDFPGDYEDYNLIEHVQMKKLLENMMKYYQLHIDGFKKVNSYQILCDVFN